ncbi:MAG TPA: hypothetical protein VF092_13180 [Longimicrobium sp.]
MISLMPRRERRIVDQLVRVAGSEGAFEAAIHETRRRVGRTPQAAEVLLTILRKRERELERQIAAGG